MKSKRVIIKGANADLIFLVEQIQLARSLKWEQTDAVAYFKHCMICGYPFNPDDRSLKYHAGSPNSRGWLDPDCYQRFIQNDGIPELKERAFEEDDKLTS